MMKSSNAMPHSLITSLPGSRPFPCPGPCHAKSRHIGPPEKHNAMRKQIVVRKWWGHHRPLLHGPLVEPTGDTSRGSQKPSPASGTTVATGVLPLVMVFAREPDGAIALLQTIRRTKGGGRLLAFRSESPVLTLLFDLIAYRSDLFLGGHFAVHLERRAWWWERFEVKGEQVVIGDV